MPILFEFETIEDNLKLATELGLDFVELVPTSVVDNQQYAEDWY